MCMVEWAASRTALTQGLGAQARVRIHNRGRHWLHREDLPRPGVCIRCPPAKANHHCLSGSCRLHPSEPGSTGYIVIDIHTSEGAQGQTQFRHEAQSAEGEVWLAPGAPSSWLAGSVPPGIMWPLLLCHFVRQLCQCVASSVPPATHLAGAG